MEKRMTWLTEKLDNLRSQVSKEDYSNWLQLTETKMLFLHLEIDLEEHKDKWANLVYYDDSPKNWVAQGQTSYILELVDIIKNPYSEEEEEEEEKDEG